MPASLLKPFTPNTPASCWLTTARHRLGVQARVEQMETSARDLAAMGYKFQFITLAGFHALNTSMFELAQPTASSGMAGYLSCEREFALANEVMHEKRTQRHRQLSCRTV
jgi:isocitrate lyase